MQIKEIWQTDFFFFWLYRLWLQEYRACVIRLEPGAYRESSVKGCVHGENKITQDQKLQIRDSSFS